MPICAIVISVLTAASLLDSILFTTGKALIWFNVSFFTCSLTSLLYATLTKNLICLILKCFLLPTIYISSHPPLAACWEPMGHEHCQTSQTSPYKYLQTCELTCSLWQKLHIYYPLLYVIHILLVQVGRFLFFQSLNQVYLTFYHNDYIPLSSMNVVHW